MPFCPKCGNSVNDTESFCQKCGTELVLHNAADQEKAVNAEAKPGVETSDKGRIREISQSRAAISTAVGIILFVDLFAVISLASEGAERPGLIFGSIFFDIFLGIFLLLGKSWARTWMLVRTIIGLVVLSLIYAVSNDFGSVFIQVGFCVAVILLLTGTSTRPRIWGSIALFIVLFLVGIFYSAYDLITSTTPAPPETSISSPPSMPSIAPPAPITSTTPAPESPSIASKELPAPTVNLPATIGEMPQSVESISAKYSWAYRGDWTWEMKIPLSVYQYYQQLPRPPTKNYSVYVTHPTDDPYIDMVVKKIEAIAQEEGYTEYQTVEFAAAFVQSLPYTVDSVTSPYDEYPRYPIETLVDNGGDCEDTSILLASIIDKMGYGVILINLPNHLGVGVKGGENIYGTCWEYKGSKYYYIETTGEKWEIGQLPDEYKSNSASIYPMIPVPIVTHEGSIKGTGYFAEVELTVSNLGTAPAYNVSALAGFDAGGGMVWNSQHSEPFTLGVGQQATVKLNLRIPFGEHTRLRVQIEVDGVLVDESYSDWFDT